MKVLETKDHWIIKCKACNRHYIPKAQLPNKSWAFDGNHLAPTFIPSVNEACNPIGHPDYQPEIKSSRCHFIITNGMIQYCDDCTHDLVGQTVPLESFTDIEIKMHNYN